MTADGNLDLYVVNYIVFDIAENPWCGLKEKGIRAYCEPDNFPAQSDTLFRNNGDGTFTDVTKSAGIYNATGKGLGVVWGDYDNDGALDIYIANDSTENLFYRNNGDGTFEEVGFMVGVALSEDGAPENGMGTAFGDWNNDGWFDLTVTNYAQQTNTLYHNDSRRFLHRCHYDYKNRTDYLSRTSAGQLPLLITITMGIKTYSLLTDICTIISPRLDRKAPTGNAISFSEITVITPLPSPLKPSVLV